MRNTKFCQLSDIIIRFCPAFYGNRAACHMMLGQFVQALEDARTSVQFDPNFVKGYVRVAKCCVALGELHAARQVK